MPDLATFQRQFANSLLADEPRDSAFAVPAFAVYRNTAARGEVEALRATYPTIDLLVGDEAFTEIALEFRRVFRPAGPVLSDYGAQFADFLAGQPWTGELPYVADVARLDWLWLQSFLAADRSPSVALVRSASRVMLHPATRIAWLDTPAMTIWLAHREPQLPEDLALEWVSEGAMFTRPGRTIQAELIDAPMYRLLDACAGVMSVFDLEAIVTARFPDADVAHLVRRAVKSGALVFS